MSGAPLVSAVIAAYNHEDFVDEAVRSLVAQSHQHIELIVIDDGSTDQTFARVKSLESDLRHRFARVEIQTQQNQGSASTIARGLKCAQSDFVYLLDSDDVAAPEAIASLLPLMSADTAIAVGDNVFVNAEGQSVQRWDERPYSTLVSFCTRRRNDFLVDRDFGSYPSLIAGNYVPNGWLLRRSLVDDAGGYRRDLVLDDWPLLLRVAKKYRVRFAGSVLARYRLHDRNTVEVQKQRILVDTARVLLEERLYCHAVGLEEQWERHARHVFSALTADQIRKVTIDSTGEVAATEIVFQMLDQSRRYELES